MTTKTFVNCTQHALGADQLALLAGCAEVVDLREVNPELFDRLANTPSDEDECQDLAAEFVQYFWDLGQKNSVRQSGGLILHLPIGSPYFQALVAMAFGNEMVQMLVEELGIEVWMSHSQRVASEKDGIKTSIFKFEKFLKMP